MVSCGLGSRAVRSLDWVRERAPLGQVAAQLQSLPSPCDRTAAHVCEESKCVYRNTHVDENTAATQLCSSLTFADSVQHDGDLLIFTHSLFEEADEDAIGRVLSLHLIRLSINTPEPNG